MRLSKYFFLFLLFFGITSASSQTFTVTTTADSGPGSLREGLLNAPVNNTTGTYLINFNLPGNPSDYANRTIRLRSQLPIIPSNVTIDGSSQQSWPALGVSGAKVILEPEFTTSTFSGLVIGQYNTVYQQTKNVEIYGLYLRNFARIPSLQNVNTSQGSGIVIDYGATDIKIGAAGKGNVIGGTLNGILIQNNNYYITSTIFPKITIQSNLIGVLYDGTTAIPNVTGISGNLYDCDLDIGGDNTGDGNVISANQTGINISRNYYYSSTTRSKINIINNKIGTDYTGTKDFHELPLFLSSSSLEIYGVKVNSTLTDLYVRKNIISGNRTWGIAITNADFVLTGNALGTGIQGTERLGNGGGLKVNEGATGTVGGTTNDEVNRIGYNNYGIESTSAKPVKITRNSMFCNKIFGIGKALNNFQPYVQVLKKRADFVSGKATPNAEVELFYTENCEGICEGRTYFRTVQAGSDGRWEYSGPLTGMVTATASLLNAKTSPFSTAALLENEAVIEPVTCNGNGSIKVPEPREGFTFTWNKIINDGGRVYLGNTQEVTGLDVGAYELIIDDGCKPISHLFEIKDQKLTDPVVTPPVPSCGQLMFQFSAEVFRGKGTIIYQWLNEAGNIVATGKSVSMPEGTYKVKVTDEAGCTKESAFYTIKRLPAPIIGFNSRVISPAACGQQNGAIKGITVTDLTGTASYKWFVYDMVNNRATTTVAGTALDLENVAGGYYVLEVTDQGSCSPVRTSAIYINIYNSVIISGGTSRNATCNTSNGAINNVTITEANSYEWFNSSNVSLEKGAYSTGIILSLRDRAPGTYTLVATNTVTGCSNTRTFTIFQTVPQVYNATVQINATTCGLINGSVVLNYSSVRPSRYVWKDASGTEITGTATELKGLAAGSYTMYAYDTDGCETVFGPYLIEITPLLTIVPASATVVDDGCGLRRASVTGISVIGGIAPYDYKWIDENGTAVQYTQDLTGITGGNYRLVVTDKTSCGTFTSEVYTVRDIPFELQTPVVNDMRICYASEIMLPVSAPEEGIYQLFREMTDARPLYETDNGMFVFKVSKTGDHYVRRTLGNCTSEFVKVHIEVTNDNLEVMNTITPNGDGMNDTWLIKGLPDYSNINIKVYTRAGQLVYESVGRYDKPFDGRFRGKELPAGVYFFRIDLRADCKPMGGSINLLR